MDTAPGVLIEQPRDAKELLALAQSAPTICSIVGATGFSPDSRIRQVVAHGGMLVPAAGPAWFAAGDAAIHFDPISSQGLLNALSTGRAVAESASRVLSGFPMGEAAEEYNRLVCGIYDAYRAHLTGTYQLEQRWTHTRFWAGRHNSKNTSVINFRIQGEVHGKDANSSHQEVSEESR